MTADDAGLFRHPFSWRSRVFRATAALVVLVVAVRLVWGWQTHRALSAKLAELHHQGQPVEVDDVVYAAVPDAQNAWHYQTSAAQAIVSGVDSPSSSNLTYNGYPPFPPAWWKLAEASEKAHGAVFSLARQARRYPRVQFRDRLTSPIFMAAIPSMNPARMLANTVADGVLYSHLTGNDPEALDRALDVLHLARSLRHDDILTPQLVAIAIEDLALHRVQVIAPGLRLRQDAPDAAATRDRVNQIIRQLLDEDLAWHGLTASLEMEQLQTIDSMRTLTGSTWFIRPLADRQLLRDLRNARIAIQASRLHTMSQVDAVLANIRTEPVNYSFVSAAFASRPATVPRYSRCFNFDAGSRSGYFKAVFGALAERRMTAVSLAAQLYRADHDGAWPEALADLVPAYLPALPADLYHDDGRPFGYVIAHLPDGTPRPLVYYDTGDISDDVGLLPEPMYGTQPDRRPGKGGRAIRQYRDLSRFTPPTRPASTKAVDGDPEIPDAPGNDAQH